MENNPDKRIINKLFTKIKIEEKNKYNQLWNIYILMNL